MKPSTAPAPTARLAGPPANVPWGPRGNLRQYFRDPIAYMIDLHSRYGNLAALVRDRPSFIFTFGAAYNQQILSNAELFHRTGAIQPGSAGSALARLGMGLLSMNGEQHKVHRHMLLPAFAQNKYAQIYYASMVGITEQVLSTWRIGETRNLLWDMQHLTLRIVSHALFGITSTEEVEAMRVEMQRWLGANFSILARMLPRDYPGMPYRRLIELSKRFQEHLLALIARRRANPEQPENLLSFLLQAHENGQISFDELIGHMATLFTAGLETSSNALAWTLFLLSQHPPVTAQLLDEITAALSSSTPTLEQLQALPYLDCCIKESLRLLPPAPATKRYSTQAFALGPHSFAAGTQVICGHYVTHREPELYPQPEQYLPERWGTLNPSPYAFVPFGAGPHTCIGARFALTEIKLILAMILQRYRLDLAAGARIDRDVKIALTPKHGMPMTIHRQDRQHQRSKGIVRGNIHEMVYLPT